MKILKRDYLSYNSQEKKKALKSNSHVDYLRTSVYMFYTQWQHEKTTHPYI